MNHQSLYTCPATGRVAIVQALAWGSVQVLICKPEKAAEMNSGIYHDALIKAGFVCAADEAMIAAHEEQEANRFALTSY